MARKVARPQFSTLAREALAIVRRRKHETRARSSSKNRSQYHRLAGSATDCHRRG